MINLKLYIAVMLLNVWLSLKINCLLLKISLCEIIQRLVFVMFNLHARMQIAGTAKLKFFAVEKFCQWNRATLFEVPVLLVTINFFIFSTYNISSIKLEFLIHTSIFSESIVL